MLWYLRKDKKRFAELNKLIPQIAERMLFITLKQLENDGIVREFLLTGRYRPCIRLLSCGSEIIPQSSV